MNKHISYSFLPKRGYQPQCHVIHLGVTEAYIYICSVLAPWSISESYLAIKLLAKQILSRLYGKLADNLLLLSKTFYKLQQVFVVLTGFMKFMTSVSLRKVSVLKINIYMSLGPLKMQGSFFIWAELT